MKVALSLTHGCNLACRYCYAGRAAKSDMSLETARKCIDLALETTPEDDSLSLCFFGGEPLLRFDLVREITAYAYRKAGESGKPVNISITTNGTLVDSEVIDFAADQRVQLCFSIDGPADMHDRNRIFPDGRGSFTDVMRRLEQSRKRLDDIQVNSVFGPATVMDLPRCLQFFVDSGIALIHLNPDITAAWPDEIIVDLREVYTRVAQLYIDCYTREHEIAINLFDGKMLLFIKGGYGEKDKCSMGDKELGIAPGGNIYPCERFIGEDDDSQFCLGNIHTGFDRKRCCALRGKRGNHDLRCMDCRLRNYCMNWCGCTNYFMSGQTDRAAPVLCAMEQAAIGAAWYAFNSLVNAGNELFADHMYRYVNAGIHYR